MASDANPTQSSPAPPQTASRFDTAAATWDDNPHRRQLTEAIARAVRQTIPLQPHWRALEYGCGTAALGFCLVPHVREVVAADASEGMIAQVQRKLAQHPGTKLTPMRLDLSLTPPPAKRFDLIVTAMALHHVDDTPLVLTRLAAMLTEHGWLAVADLCLEDGSFHAPEPVPHNGFAPEALARIVAGATGPAAPRWQVVHAMPKNGRNYDVFLLTVQRGA